MSDSINPIKLGIIGSGLAVEQLHFPAIKKLPGKYEIVVACDIDDGNAQKTAKLAAELGSPNCRTTNDYREVLADQEVEAVLISLPIHLNAQVMVQSVQAGKHILAEKPLASNLQQAQELYKNMKGFSNLVIEVAENFHYRKDIAQAKEWIAGGKIGQPFFIQMSSIFYTNTDEGFASTPWRHDNQYRGGLFADAAVHNAAALRELGGELEQLQAFTKSVHPIIGAVDTVVLNMRYRNGVLGHLTFTGAAKTTQATSFKVNIFGTDGTIIMDGKLQLVEGINQNAKVVEELSASDEDGGYYGEFNNFYEALRNKAPVVATVKEALEDMRIIMYALDSAETSSVILF